MYRHKQKDTIRFATLLHYAVWFDATMCLECLLRDRDRETNEQELLTQAMDGYSPLMYAVSNENPMQVKIIVDFIKKSQRNKFLVKILKIFNNSRNTALHIALEQHAKAEGEQDLERIKRSNEIAEILLSTLSDEEFNAIIQAPLLEPDALF